MSSETATIHIDGASRGNPGDAAFAYVIAAPGLAIIEVAERMGSTTNNVAEYTALIRALRAAKELGLRRLEIFSDSELMVKQMQGAYRVKNEGLKPLFEEAQALLDEFASVRLKHVRREFNKRADELCNLALDGRLGADLPEATSSAAPSRLPAPSRDGISDTRVRDDAIECLRSAAQAWALHGPERPDPAIVWEQLWSILEEGDVLKKPRRRAGS